MSAEAVQALIRTLLDDTPVDVDDVWDQVEDGILAGLPESEGLQVRPGGWILDLKQSAVRATLGAALIGGLMAPAGLDQLPGYVLPAVIPLLLDVRSARLTRTDRKLLLEVRMSQTTAQMGMPWPAAALYARLPTQVQAQVSEDDFEEFIEALNRAGEVDVDEHGEVSLREAGRPAWIRITLN